MRHKNPDLRKVDRMSREFKVIVDDHQRRMSVLAVQGFVSQLQQTRVLPDKSEDERGFFLCVYFFCSNHTFTDIDVVCDLNGRRG